MPERLQQGDTIAAEQRPEAEQTEARPARRGEAEETLVLEELLVEDVSIDGMCGVY